MKKDYSKGYTPYTKPTDKKQTDITFRPPWDKGKIQDLKIKDLKAKKDSLYDAKESQAAAIRNQKSGKPLNFRDYLNTGREYNYVQKQYENFVIYFVKFHVPCCAFSNSSTNLLKYHSALCKSSRGASL